MKSKEQESLKTYEGNHQVIQRRANDKDPIQDFSNHTQNNNSNKILGANYLNTIETFGLCSSVYFL